MRALYQRRKGRDLFDLHRALSEGTTHADRILSCFRTYMEFVVDRSPSQKEFVMNLEQKMSDPVFLGDTEAILRPDTDYDPAHAFEHVMERLISKL